MSPSRFTSPNPHKLFRNQDHAQIFGVCAGAADYLGADVRLVRFAAVAGLVFFTLPTLGGYLAAAVVLKPRPARVFTNRMEEEFWRTVTTEPDRSVTGLAHSFRDLEMRLRALEAHATSQEFSLHRAFRGAFRDTDR